MSKNEVFLETWNNLDGRYGWEILEGEYRVSIASGFAPNLDLAEKEAKRKYIEIKKRMHQKKYDYSKYLAIKCTPLMQNGVLHNPVFCEDRIEWDLNRPSLCQYVYEGGAL